MPKCEFESWAKESTYAYPPVVEVAKAKEKEKVKTAILSTTHKVQAREAKKAEAKAAKAKGSGAAGPAAPPAPPAPTPEPVSKWQDCRYTNSTCTSVHRFLSCVLLIQFFCPLVSKFAKDQCKLGLK